MRLLVLFIVVATGVLPRRCEAISCEKDEFTCTDGERCVGKSFVCDDFPNCVDHSDEQEDLCESWSYEDEDEDAESEGGGWIGLWGGKDDEDENEIEEVKHVHEKPDIKEEEVVDEMCSLDKCIAFGPLSYASDRKYNYKYEVLTQSATHNESQKSSTLTTCDVVFNIMTACEMSVKISNVVSKSSTTASNGEPTEVVQVDSLLKSIEKEELRFSMIGGEVNFLCPKATEDPRALNFKRGVLSMIQNSMPVLHLPHSKTEKDVVGECLVNYEFEPVNGPNTVITKTRDVPTCKRRSQMFSASRSVTYEFPMESPSFHILDTTSSCQQRLKNGIILSANCEEKHTFVPLKSENGEIVTTLKQTLTFENDGYSTSSLGRVERRTDLVFDHQNYRNNDLSMDAAAANKIIDLFSMPDKIPAKDWNKGAAFNRLVTVLRLLSYDELLKLHDGRAWSDQEKKVFSDALKMVGTDSSLRLLTHKRANDIGDWIESLSYITKPTLDIIAAASEIVDLSKRPNEAFLFIGTMVNNYCLHNPSCQYHKSIIDILEKFKSILMMNCKPHDLERKLEALFILRGLGNAGPALNADILDTLNTCLLDERSDLEVRITSIDAFRGVACNISRTSFEEILSDFTEDSELRIRSYLALMRCPNYRVLQFVEKILDVEEVNQVGSFIWTHLKNIQETSSPSKMEIQFLLSNRRFQEKFKSDFRKYSRNIEWSGFYSEKNIGAFVDSNIIFSQQSYVPRSLSFNFTADLFGRSFNLFEIETRVEGLEKHIANYLGENVLRMENQREAITNSQIKEKIDQAERRQQFLDKETEISFNIKTFGNDVSYHRVNGIGNMVNYVKKFDPVAFLSSLREGKDFHLQKSWLPLDSSYHLATSAGMPLRLSLEGGASVDMAARLEADLWNFFSAKGKMQGFLRPTVSIDLRASMIIDSLSVQTGVEMESAFHSSIDISGNIEIDKAKTFSVDLNVPKDTMEIVKVSSKLSLIHGSPSKRDFDNISKYKETIRNLVPGDKRSEECTPYHQIIGAKFCWSSEYPDAVDSSLNPKLLLNGPFYYKMTLEKTDPTLYTYKFRYHWNIGYEDMSAILHFDTPGSTFPRELAFNLNVNYRKHDVNFVIKNPHTSLEAKGRYKWQDDEKSLDASINLNGEGVSSISVGYKLYDRSGQRVLIPTFAIDWKSKTLIKIKGNLEQRQKSADDNAVYYSVNLSFELYGSDEGNPGNGLIEGFLSHKNGEWDTSLNVVYRFEKSGDQQERIKLEYKRIMKIDGPPHKAERTWRLFFTQFPNLNCKGKWSTKSFAGSLENDFKISFGMDFDNPLHEVNLYHNIIFYGGDQTTFNSSLVLKYPKTQLDIAIGADLYYDLRDINTGFIFRYITGNTVTSRFHLIRNRGGNTDVEGNWHLQVPNWLDLSARGKVKAIDERVHDFDFEFSWGPSKRIEFAGHLTDSSTKLKLLHEVEVKIKLPSKDIIYTFSTFLYDADQVILASQVKLQSGENYKLRMAYINQLDDYKALQKRIEIDLKLPTKAYYWHSEITFGEFITLSNDIHLDRDRDLNLWIQIQQSKGLEQRRIKSKFLWDANRDPNKKTELELFLAKGLFRLTFSVAVLGNQYKASWESFKQYGSSDESLFWTHKHSGEISWGDQTRQIKKITSGLSFTLNRKVGAELVADAYLTTPFEQWSNNTAHFGYVRDSEKIVATLKSKWHMNEFLNLTYELAQEVKVDRVLGETKVEVLAFINENFVTFSTGVVLKKTKGNVDGSAYIKWDDDRLELLINAKDESGPRDTRMSISSKIFSSLKGYSHLSTFVDIYAVKGSLAIHASAIWEEIIYEFILNGDLYSAQNYLKGEIILKTPLGGPEAAIARIRIYHDPEKHDENLQIFGRWHGKELDLQGRVAAHPQDFKAELLLITPFEKLSQASVTLGHSLKGHYQTIALVKWNKTKSLGFDIESKIISLTDFLMRLSLTTPFLKYKEIRAEFKNYFSLSPSVRAHSRIFGQIDEKKSGIGVSYEQGQSPKLLVGLEFYSPIEDLKEIRFGFSDSSILPKMKYSVHVQYGESRAISIDTEFEKRDKLLNVAIRSKLNMASLWAADSEEVELVGEMKMEWAPASEFSIRLAAITNSNNYKIFATGLIGPESSGKLEVNLALPVRHLEDLEIKVDYRKATYWKSGYLKVKAISSYQTLVYIYMFGTLRDIILSFTLPIQNFSKGSLTYKIIPLDVVRSKVEATASLEERDFQLDGTLYLNQDNYITKMEVTVSSRKDLNPMTVIVEGEPDVGGFRNRLSILREEKLYDANVLWDIDNENAWNINGTLLSYTEGKEFETSYALKYENIKGNPLRVVINCKGHPQTDDIISFDLKLQKRRWPYEGTLEWVLPNGSGEAVVSVESFQNERVAVSGTVSWSNNSNSNSTQTFELKTDFSNRSTKDVVDLVVNVEFHSNHHYWDHLLLDGNLRQVTPNENGVLRIHLEWPQMEPVTLSAEATVINDPAFDLRTSIQLELSRANYGFLGHIKHPDEHLSLSGGLWWKRVGDPERRKVFLTVDINFVPGGFKGKGILTLPMVQGFEINTCDMTYHRKEAFNFVEIVSKAGEISSTLKAVYKSGDLPATEGNITLSSTKFWEGEPLLLRFSQSLTESGYNGHYYFEWPLWDLKTESYVREPIKATLEHNKLSDGHQGVFQIQSRLTKGKAVKLTYTFKFPSRAYVLVKLGIEYEHLKLELKGEHSVTLSQNQKVRKTAIEIDNLIWPFGVAYFEESLQVSSDGEETWDRIEVYDLDNTSSRSSVSIVRTKNNKGARFAIKGKFVERDLEASCGYKTLPNNLGADLILSWEKDSKLHFEIDWKDKSKLPMERNHLLAVKISHPLRELVMDIALNRSKGKTYMELIFNADRRNPKKEPLKAVLMTETPSMIGSEDSHQIAFTLSHPSLHKSITLEGKIARNYGDDILNIDLLFSYSKLASQSIVLHGFIRRMPDQKEIQNQIEIVHEKTNLQAKASGTISYGSRSYSFAQDLSYANENGTRYKALMIGDLDLINRTLLITVEAPERVIDLKMRIEEKEKGKWQLVTTSETHPSLPFTTSWHLHPSQPVFVLTIESLRQTSNESIVPTQDDPPRYMAKKAMIEGGYEDKRHVHFSMKHLEEFPLGNNNSWLDDAHFSLKLNHSRLLSGSFEWRKEIQEEIKNEMRAVIGLSREMKESVIEWLKENGKLLLKEISSRARPIYLDISQESLPLIWHLKNESREFKEDLLKVFRTINLTEKERNLKMSIEYTLTNLGKSLEKIAVVKRVKAILAKGTLKKALLDYVEKMKNFTRQLLSQDGSRGGLVLRLKSSLSSLASAYDQAVKQWYLAFRNAMEDFNMRLREWLREKWHSLYENYKPHILKTLHLIESASFNIVSKLWNYMNQLGEDIKSISYVQTIQQTHAKIKALYDEMSGRTLKANLEFFYNYSVSKIMETLDLFVEKALPFAGDWMEEIQSAWSKLNSYDNAKIVIDFGTKLINNTIWILSKLDIRENVIDFTGFIIENGYTIVSQAATEAHLKSLRAKTDMTWSPERGEIRLIQKLPFEWISFKETPGWQELMEVPMITSFKKLLFPATKASLLETWYKYFNLNFYPSTWIPPFQATAYIIGENHLMTFDGKSLNFRGSCEHLLAADLVYGRWAITIKYNDYASKKINVYSDEKVIEISRQFKVKINGNMTPLPYALPSTLLWRTVGTLNLVIDSGPELAWNVVHDVISIKVPRTAFLNTAGLLGTNNNEPRDDLTSPDRKIQFSEYDLTGFAESWKVSESSCQTVSSVVRQPSSPERVDDICENLFSSTMSPFKYCFYQVEPRPYYEICKQDFEGQDKFSSSVALAYREKCTENSVPVKLPVNYVRCQYSNASSNKVMTIQEGQTVTLRKEDIAKEVEVVLLIEMKSCNHERVQTNDFKNFIARFHDGLIQEGVTSARYAVVSYGGIRPYATPSVISTSNDIFTTSEKVGDFIRNLNFTTEDVVSGMPGEAFEAITYAANMAFGTPVSVAFMLFPCSPCTESYGLDYSTMYHILMNNAASLHIFKNTYFDIEKDDDQTKILGYDKEKAFLIKHYNKNKMGDSGLKKQIRPPKGELNLCLPLALETNGAVYTSEFLTTPRKKLVERFGVVVGRRVAETARQDLDQKCLCLSTQEVTPLMRCERWEDGDISVLKRYGLEVGDPPSYYEDKEKRADFYPGS